MVIIHPRALLPPRTCLVVSLVTCVQVCTVSLANGWRGRGLHHQLLWEAVEDDEDKQCCCQGDDASPRGPCQTIQGQWSLLNSPCYRVRRVWLIQSFSLVGEGLVAGPSATRVEGGISCVMLEREVH